MSANRPNDPPSEAELRRWRRNWSASRRRLPGGIVFGLLLTTAVFVALSFDACPWWLYLLGLLAAWYQAGGDAINLSYLGRRLRSAERDEPS